TGRPRRVGWFDAVVARTSVRISGVDAIALTKLDVLDDQDEIRICHAYTIDGVETREIPARADFYAVAQPVFRSFPGWKTSIAGISSFDELPARAREYLVALEEAIGCKVA